MTSPTVLVFCFCACFAQSITAQCFGAYNGISAEGLAWPSANNLAWEAAAPYRAAASAAPCATSASYSGLPYGASGPFAFNEWEAGFSPATLAASNGGGFAVTSVSPISPTGVTMTSENAYEGPLAVTGSMPFLGAVALEGHLPTIGGGSVAYGSGNGKVAMINEDYSAGYGIGALNYEAGIANPGYGYNGLAGPIAMEASIAGPFAYNNVNSARIGGCGCGAVF